MVSTMGMHSHTFSEERTKRRVYALLLVEVNNSLHRTCMVTNTGQYIRLVITYRQYLLHFKDS